VKAETQLLDGDMLGDVDALAKLSQDLDNLTSETTFGTLTARLRTRAFFAKAVAAAMEAYLNGKTQDQVMEAARVSATRAYGSDAKVDERWEGRLSEKMVKLFAKFKQQ